MKNNTIIQKTIRIIFGTVAILLIPLIAMQLTDQVVWTIGDFVVAGVLLLGAGALCELVFSRLREKKHKILFAIIFAAAFFLIWAELAAGLFGTPFAGS